MSNDLREFALRLKVIEIMDRYYKVRKHMHIMGQWKKMLIHPN